MANKVEMSLKLAGKYYEEARTLIWEMSRYAQVRNKVFSYEKAMWRFDAILQTVLLNVAVEDGSFSLPDEQFIRQLTRYGDAMVIINEEARKHTPGWSMTWSGIAGQRQSFGKELATYATAVMQRVAEEFAADFAPVDSMVARDYLSELRDCMLKIMVHMSLVDEEINDAENLKSVSVLDTLLRDKWAKYLGDQPRPSKTTPKKEPAKKETEKTASGGENQVNFSSDYLVNHNQRKDIYTNAVIFIEVDTGTQQSCGSGVVITRNGYALTCAHVVDGAKRMKVKIAYAGQQPRFVNATIFSVDKQNDLALIKLQDGTYYHAELDLDRTEPVLGENIAIYGYPFGSRMNDNVLDLSVSYCRGYVASNQTIGGCRRTLLDITIRSGNSGSPVTSLENGKVIGIAFGGYTGSDPRKQDAAFYSMTPMQYVRRLFNKK